jgi:DNA adenine methylase
MTASPLKWHGAKSPLASRIVAEFPPRRSEANPDGWLHFVEPFFGAGSIMLHQNPEGISEVANDLNKDLTNFWRVLQGGDSFAAFSRLAQATPFSEAEWNDAALELAEWPEPCEEASTAVVRAWRFFIACRQSLAGRMDSFAPLSRTRTRRSQNEQVSAWLTAVDGLPAVHARLKRVVILNRPAIEVIRQQAGPKTLTYVDAPYVAQTRTAPDVYQHEMADLEHVELINTMLDCEGSFAVSMYHHPIYDALHLEHGWRLVEFDVANHAAGGARKARMTECLWIRRAS